MTDKSRIRSIYKTQNEIRACKMRTVSEDDPKNEIRRHNMTKLSTYRLQNEIRTSNMRISSKTCCRMR